MRELKPCPFCGSDNLSIESEWPDSTKEYFWVYCHNCEVEGPKCGDDTQEAVELWNLRASTVPAKSDVETCNVTGNEWTRFIPRARLWFDDNGTPALETEVNDLACLLQSVATETRAEERERCAKVCDRLGNNHIIDSRVRTGFIDAAAAIRKGEP